jgi:hypothetical protein
MHTNNVRHMDNHHLQPLEQDDMLPYDPEFKKVVVRIYKGNKWFAGMLSSISMKDSSLKLRVKPMARLHAHIGREEDIADWPHTIRPGDRPISSSYADEWQPFTLANPQKVLPDAVHPDTLIIVFADGAVILSKQPEDIAATEEFLDIARSN